MPTLHRWSALEAILNRNIAASSEARAACRRLIGRTLALEFLLGTASTKFIFYFTCNDDTVCIESSTANSELRPFDTRISGTPLAYISMIRPNPKGTISGGLRVEGDAEVAQAFRDLMQAAKPDVEEELSRLVGDVAAHQLTRFAQDMFDLGKRASTTFAQNVSEFLQEESRDVVTRVEIDEFNIAVDRVRDDVERAAARLERLEITQKKNRS
jgi:ubiquinone biosynthesis accessory factor UbiJ